MYQQFETVDIADAKLVVAMPSRLRVLRVHSMIPAIISTFSISMRIAYDNEIRRYNYRADSELSYDALLSKSIKCTLSFASRNAIFRGFAKESQLN